MSIHFQIYRVSGRIIVVTGIRAGVSRRTRIIIRQSRCVVIWKGTGIMIVAVSVH